jgi:quercetin dioxygenase-like cupin family protein
MRRGTKLTMPAVVLATLMLVACGGREAPDGGLVEDLETIMPAEPEVPATAAEAPEHTEIVYAGTLVTITRIALEPVEAVPEHQAPYRVLYVVSGADLEVDHEGTLQVIPLEAGEVHALEAGKYSFRNVGDEPLELVAVARTDVDIPENMEFEPKTVPAAGWLLLETDRVRVRELDLEPDAMVELPAVPIRVVYARGAVVLEYVDASGEVERVETVAGATHVRPGGDRSVTVRGSEAGRIIVFEWLE